MVGRVRSFILYRIAFYFISSALCVGILGAVLVGYFSLKQTYIETLFSRQNTALVTAIENINLSIQSQISTLKNLAKNPKIIDFMKSNSQQTPTSENLKKELAPITDTILLFSVQYLPIFSSDGKISSYQQSAALQESIQRSLILGDIDISNLFFSTDKLPSIFITAPIIAENQFLGTIAIAFNPSVLKKLSNEIIIMTRAHDDITALFSSRSDTDASQTAQDHASYQHIFQEATQGTSGATIVRNNTHKKILLTWQYMPLTEWGIVLTGSYDTAMQPFFMIKIIAALLILLCSIGISYIAYKAWQSMQKMGSPHSMFKKILLTFLYFLFVCNIVLFLIFITNKYHEYAIHKSQSSTLLKGTLQQAAQTVDYKVSLLENIARSLALDITSGRISSKNIINELEEEMQDNPDMLGIVYASQDNNSWKLVSCFHENKVIKTVQTTESQGPPWVQQALQSQGKWILAKNQLSKESQPMFVLPVYNKQDAERKSPQGVIAIIYTKDALMQNAHQKIGAIPLLLALNDGTIINKDKNIPLQGPSVDVSRNTSGNLYLAEITHLSWYLGSILQPTSLHTIKIVKTLITIILILSNITLYSYSFLWAHRTIVPEKSNKRLFAIALLIVLCTTIAYLLTRR